MAVCVGCGLEVNNGLLEVNVCGTPVTPNITTGGLQCDTTTESGCLKVVLNDTHAGCGLNAVQGQLVVDPCLNGGILCGDTADDPEDNCIYVNVQGQGNAACVVLATITGGGTHTCPACGDDPTDTTPFQSAPRSPNCNGMIRTCDGLWAPPAQGSFNFSCGQISRGPGTIQNVLQPIGAQAGDMAANLDTFANHNTDSLYGTAANQIIVVNAFENDGCNPINAMSWTAFNIGYVVNGGELWRWALWERLCGTMFGAPDPCANCTPLTTTCTGCGWKLQALQYIDRRNEATAAFETVQINDNSTWGFAKCHKGRLEAMISFNRLVGGPTAAANNSMIFADFQYRNMGFAYNYSVPQACATRGNA